MKKIFNRFIYFSAVVVSAMLVASCEKEVEVDLRSVEPRLVIEGKVPNGEFATVRLTKTKDFYEDNYFAPVRGAVITISDDAGNSDVLRFDEDLELYVSDVIMGVERRTYHLTVEVEDGEYTATSKMPPLVPLDSINMRFLAENIMDDYPFPYAYFQDPLGSENDYYRHLVYINGVKFTKNDAIVYSARHSDGTYIQRVITVFSNDDEDPIQKGDLITIEHQCIDRGTFLYFESLADIDNSLNNPTSNIEGGSLGYFSAYSSAQKSTIADWENK